MAKRQTTVSCGWDSPDDSELATVPIAGVGQRSAHGNTPADVLGLVRDVKARIQEAQARAVLSVNAELVRLDWDDRRVRRRKPAICGGGRTAGR